MTFLRKILTFIRAIDPHDGLLSLSNIAVIISLYRLATVQAVSFTEVGGVLVALSNYNLKKVLSINLPPQIQKVVDKTNSLISEKG